MFIKYSVLIHAFKASQKKYATEIMLFLIVFKREKAQHYTQKLEYVDVLFIIEIQLRVIFFKCWPC